MGYGDPHTYFRRILHAKGADLRAGLSRARELVEPRHYDEIIRGLARVQLYRQALTPNPFPRSPGEIQNRKRLATVSAEREFLWASSLLALYLPQLSTFNSQRIEYERALLAGRFEDAANQLAEIESSLGISIWLIASRIQVLQLQYGLKAQKDYLEQLINAPGLSPYTAYLIFFCSYRAEENVSLAALRQECRDILGVPGVGDHFRYHILSTDLSEIANPTEPIVWEDSHPIIDQWQVFVTMSQLQYARTGRACAEYLLPALERVQGAGDHRVDLLIALMTGKLPAGTPIEFDNYTEGHYKRLPRLPTPLELAARAGLFEPTYSHEFPDDSPAALAIRSMRELLITSEGYTQAQNRLEKIAMAGDKSSWAMEIVAFIQRESANATGHGTSDAGSLAALNCNGLNPWGIATFSRLTGDDRLLDRAVGMFPDSSSLQLRMALSRAPADAAATLHSLNIPEYRRELYEGHILADHGNLRAAIEHYSAAERSEIPYVSNCARRFLYAVQFDSGNYADALSLVIDDCIARPGAYRAYQIERLAEAIRERKDVSIVDELAFSILLHIAARHIHPRWERDLSDAYENALLAFGLSKPSQLIGSPRRAEISEARLVYFLRFVCVPRILDDSTEFQSVADVEAERILICQALTELDSENADAYASEIRVITRDAEVAHLLQQIEASKIYVDERGLKGLVEESLKAMFERHQVLLKSPSLEYQAEQLAKRLKEMVADKKAPPDLKHLRLPASEREGLFEAILVSFTNEFAFNLAYGLDIHLSTSIRHGVFEGHVRAPFVAEDLLSARNGDEMLPPGTWASLEGLGPSDMEQVHRALARLTQKVETLIRQWLTEFLRIRERGGTSGALFDFSTTEAEFRELMENVSTSTPYDEFVGRLLSFCWRKVDASLEHIRDQLLQELLPNLTAAADALIISLESTVGHARTQRLVDSVVRAKTNLYAEIMTIREWFKRPSDLQRSPFDMDLAVRVAIRQIEKVYRALSPTININVPFKIEGWYLDGIVEVVFLLLQNVIRHSGFPEAPGFLTVEISYEGEAPGSCEAVKRVLIIKVSNDLAPSVDVDERRKVIAEAQQRYEHDSAMKLAGREGGSGLSKLWRILQFDLDVDHRLRLEIAADRRFHATVELSGVRSC